mmetsp:Transcript_29833/g.69514  ORF Transcript_29833/g.69514 Transcript_29833/m.69514 type:complete len:123 (-) Transcript_29833:293-661(-)
MEFFGWADIRDNYGQYDMDGTVERYFATSHDTILQTFKGNSEQPYEYKKVTRSGRLVNTRTRQDPNGNHRNHRNPQRCGFWPLQQSIQWKYTKVFECQDDDCSLRLPVVGGTQQQGRMEPPT